MARRKNKGKFELGSILNDVIKSGDKKMAKQARHDRKQLGTKKGKKGK